MNQLFDQYGNELSLDEVIAMLPPIIILPSTNRVEVIDRNGRSYVNSYFQNEVQISLQDELRTLKIFIK